MLEFVNFYRFTPLPQPELTGKRWLARARSLALRGTLLLAEEGANVSVAGEGDAVQAFTEEVTAELGVRPDAIKRMPVDSPPFRRMVLKIKPEIVTTGWQTDPGLNAGTTLSPEEFHRLCDDPDVVLVDTRNLCETRVGSFRNAILLPLEGFRHLPEFLPELEKFKQKKLLTFCTGGIRCEKAVPMLKQAGFPRVYQLEGGILNYLKKYPDGHWRGECFVFDERCTVTGRLERGSYELCPNCGQPFRDGLCVSCEHSVEASA